MVMYMKKVAVLTYCEWNSYGSILQAYGLKKAIESLGYTETIYKTFRMESPIRKRVKKTLKSIAKYLLTLPHLKEINRIYKNNSDFIDENFSICFYNGYEDLKNSAPAADFYLTGSDQVWNPDAIRKEMFLDFNTSQKPRLSYAASFGSQKISEESSSYIKKTLNTFDSISVREKSMVSIIKDMDPDLDPQVHIDPTFLLPAEEWAKCSSERKGVPKKYILVYALYWNSEFNKELEALSDTTGLPVVSVQLGKRAIYCQKKLMDCDVHEFLWLIKNAEYVITSSFHGLAFSVIFNKKFSAVINPDAPSRLNDLLDCFSIENCGIRELPESFSADYKSVNKRIEEERGKGIEYLRSILYE